MSERRSGLLHATTGSGKTLAVAFGAWLAAGETPDTDDELRVLWITPMRALAADTERSLREAFASVAVEDAPGSLAWRIGARTGDTSGSERVALTRKPPRILVTTPESLSIMLTQERARETFASLAFVVVDEWHELMGNKRGVQTELALARLRHFRPGLATWGLSATIGNLEDAKRVLLGPRDAPHGALVEGRLDKPLIIDTLLPKAPERFSWAGHLGAKMVEQVVVEIEAATTTLVFTNTRSQAELWYQHILRLRPEWAGILAIHHGSLSRETRDWVEQGLKDGSLKAVVCTSSLDLGVDFLPVERVIQIGSPKGVARLLQRAGRSGHAPGRVSRITLVPTHTLELVEAAAVRDAVTRKKIESRRGLNAPLDVLAQHCVTVALGGGFRPGDLLAEVRETAAYEHLTDENWSWVLDFIRRGGPSLTAYPSFRRVAPDAKGVWRAADRHVALRHKLNIGAIVSDASVMVQYGPAPRGAKLGAVEESFVARMKAGDKFWFAGRSLEFVRLRDQTAYVRAASGGGATPRWQGGRMPLSTTLADAMLDAFVRSGHDEYDEPELAAARPLIEVQRKWSALPTPENLLAETMKSREGWHLFLYPFAGRDIHLGLTSLIAWRAAREREGAFSLSVNDYGFEILSANARDWGEILPSLIAPAESIEALTQEVIASLNAGELARRRFRDIAHIAGLVSRGFPGERRKMSVMQASSGLFYDVFRKFDPTNGLLKQAEREVLEDELDVRRLQETLRTMSARQLEVRSLKRPTPFGFPLMVQRLRERLSNETLSARIDRMVAQLEKAAEFSNAIEAVRAGMLKLLPERAVWAPAAKTLFVADLHLGKAATFRALGAPAPTSVSEETLRRLAELIDAIEPQHVVALGDFTHARAAMTPGLLKSLCAWRTRWSSLAFTIVLGNHDRGAGPFYSDCGFACTDAPALIGGIECRHHPFARDDVSGPLALAGHLHPVVRLKGPGRDSLRTPCFVVGSRQIVLPAFGEFVGGSLVVPGEGERALIATARGVFDVTPGFGGALPRLSSP